VINEINSRNAIDPARLSLDNSSMSTVEQTKAAKHSFSPQFRAELDEAIRRAISGEREPEILRRACERMDGMREENRKRFGVQEIAVNLIREARE
jgi:hypothetical protein